MTKLQILKPLQSLYSREFLDGIAHVIQQDASLESVALDERFPTFEVDTDGAYKLQGTSFDFLVRSIVGQQLSGKAANAIHGKFLALFEGNGGIKPSARQIIESNPEDMRGAGLSYRKIEYIKGLAEAFDSGTLSEDKLKTASSHDIVDMVVNQKGIGPWTADMYLLFHLRHMDVLSIGDLGVLKGFEVYLRDRPQLQQELKSVDWTIALESVHNPGSTPKALNRKPATLSSPKKQTGAPLYKQLEWVADRFRPYRSVFQLFLWKLADTDTAILAADKQTKTKTKTKTKVTKAKTKSKGMTTTNISRKVEVEAEVVVAIDAQSANQSVSPSPPPSPSISRVKRRKLTRSQAAAAAAAAAAI